MFVTCEKIECVHEIYFMNCILNQIIQLSITVNGKILLRFYSVHIFLKLLVPSFRDDRTMSYRELSDCSAKPLHYIISSKISAILLFITIMREWWKNQSMQITMCPIFVNTLIVRRRSSSTIAETFWTVFFPF